LPEEALGIGDVEIERDFDRALRQANVAMMLRIQKERLAGTTLDLGQYIARYQLSSERYGQVAQPGTVVMHPGPIIRGLEITGEMADASHSTIEEQVAQGLAVRRAVLVRALGVQV